MIARFLQAIERVKAFFQARSLDRDLRAELDSHFAMLTADNIRDGMTPAEAARRAHITLGGMTQLREAHQEVRGLPFLDTLLQDLRYTVRTLRRDLGFTVFAILIVGLGIGASATVFSVVNALLIRPLPFRNPQQLVWISNAGAEGDMSGQTFPINPFLDLRAQSKSFSDVAAYFAFYSAGDRKLITNGEPERYTGAPVSYNFFPLLGVAPQIGRLFTEEECAKGLPLVLLSDGLWRSRFAGDPNIAGAKITINDRAVTVIGVMPASFDFGSTFTPGNTVDMFIPLPLTPQVNRMGNTVSLIARLKPGAMIEQAQAEASILAPAIGKNNNRDHLQFRLSALEQHVTGRLRPALFVLSCAVFVVMMIVCANLSNLQLARTASRQKEMAIRVALGASRGRLIRQMLTESVVLSSSAGVLGVAMAIAGTRLLSRLNAVSLPLRSSVHMDATVLAFTSLVAILTGLLFGLLPALNIPSAVHGSLKDSNRGSSSGTRHSWIRASLVVSEIAFACVLLVGAGLLIRSFLRVLDVNLGFRPERAASLRVDPNYLQENTPGKRNAYFTEVLRLAADIPGIESAGLSDVLPLEHNRSWSATAKDQTYSESHPPPDAFVRIVSYGYLQSMGIPLLAGRDMTARDNDPAPRVILINETLARELWPGQNPIGKMLIADGDRQVIGVVGDVRHVALEKGSGAEMYLPILQTNDYSQVNLVVRSALPPAAIVSALRSGLHPISSNIAANQFQMLQELVDRSVSPRRLVVTLLGGFAAFAVILASLGIYGVIGYSVNQRTQEIGIRMALGASAGNMQASVLLQTLKLAAMGLLIGLAASWMLTRSLAGLLFGITPTDPVTFLAMIATLTAVAALAGYLPARRASRIDPMVALRAD